MSIPVRVRNKRGELVDAPQFTASEAKNNFGQLLDAALREGPVAITKQSKPTAVLISLEEYRALTQVEDRTLAALSAEFDLRFAAMQAPDAAASMQSAFDAPPEQLGAFAAASLGKGPAPTKAPTRQSRAKRG